MNIYKQKLSVTDQVKRLEDKGISFNVFCKERAEDYLTSNNYYYKLTSFRKNFRKHPDGVNKGKYVNLDFAYLVDLAIIDNYLRGIILEIALDIEHYSKLKLLHRLENDEAEDGYSIVNDFMISLGQNRQVLEKRILEKANSSYVGDIIQHYNGNYPAWTLIEIVSFGDYLRFYKFCANRWNDKDLLNDFYLMKDVKELRNAAAHNNCILNDVTIKESKHQTNHAVKISLKSIKRQRNDKYLAKEKIRQIVTLLYTSIHMITSDGVKRKINNQLKFLKNRIYRDYDYSFNQKLKATFDYLFDVIDIYY